jgi:NADPH:quinone reductase-like Zn-dependent oxidoreductase
MAIAYHRGRTAGLLVGNSKLPEGAMLAVGAGPDEIKGIMGKISHGRIGIACVNSPKSVTISGDKASVVQLDQILEEKGIFHRLLKVNVAYHSHHMQAVAEDYRASIAHIRPRHDCSAVRFYSSLRGHLIDTQELTADYWVQNLTSRVLFSDSLSELCTYDATVNSPSGVKFRTTVLLEIGPHAALEGPIKQTVSKGFSDGSLVYSSMLRRNKDATETAQKAAGDLFMRGIPVKVAAINRPAPGTSLPQVLTDMPPYPFQHDTTYWHSSRITQKYLSKKRPARNDIIGVLADYSNDLTPEWRNLFQLDDLPWLRDHRIQGIVTYPMAGFIAMGIEAMIQHRSLALGNRTKASDNSDDSYNTIKRINLRDVAIQRPLVLDEDVEVEMVTKLSPFMLGPHTQSETWSEFVITSWTQERGWTQHCRGLISTDTESSPTKDAKNIDEAGEAQDGISPQVSNFYNEKDCILTTGHEDMYDSLQAAGTGYGKMFQGLRNIAISGTGELSVADLLVSDTASIMPHGYEKNYMVHPTILENSFQAIWPLLGAGTSGLDALYMVTAVQEMSVACGIRNNPKSQLRVSAAPELASQQLRSASEKKNGVRKEADTSFSVAVTAPDNPGQALIRLDGLKVLPLYQTEDIGIKQSSRGLCYKLEWEPVFEDNVLNSGSSSGADTCSEGSNELSFALLDLVTVIYRREDQFDMAFKLSKTLESLTGTLVELQPFDTDADITITPSGVVIVLIEIGKSLLPSLSDTEFQWMKKTVLQAGSLLWVSQNAYAGHQDPNSYLAMGLARCIRAETGKKFAVLDLEASTTNHKNSPVKDIIAHVTEVFTRSLSPPGQVGSPYPCSDMEYRVRNDQLQVPRVVHDDKADNFVQSEAHKQHVIEMQPFFSREKDIRPPLKLFISTPGVLDSLYFIPDPVVGTPLEADEVEIEIKATAVNSRDIAQAMGHLPGKFIGLECSGVITKVGSRVRRFAVGERVCAVNTKGAYSQLTRCKYTGVAKIPEDMTFATAATIPAAYCTAYYSLIKMGRLSRGETVLIHAGTSDVGIAAIKLAQYVGAEVYVTVKSNVEKMFLMDSFKDSLPKDHILYYPDSNFGPALRQAMAKHGQGVDVILNSSSVSGDRLRETWECIAHFGRFIEIGKRDIEANLGLPMRPFDYNAMFCSVDLAIIADEKPQLMKQLMSDVMTMIRNGIISPLSAGQTKQISEVVEAFGIVQSGEVINKLVVLHSEEERVKVSEEFPSLVFLGLLS